MRQVEEIEYLKGFLAYCRGKGVRALLIHGHRAGIQNVGNDVDLLLDLPDLGEAWQLIENYHLEVNWEIGRVMPHEVDCAWFGCVPKGQHSPVVALDIHLSLKESGVVLAPKEEVFAQAGEVNGGWWHASPGHELVYRFAKASRKGKAFVEVVESLGDLWSLEGEPLRKICQQWGVKVPEVFSEGEVGRLLREVSGRLRSARRSPGRLAFSAARVLIPTGLVQEGAEVVDLKSGTGALFGRLRVFESHAGVRNLSQILKLLVTSHLVILPSPVSGVLRSALRAGGVYSRADQTSLVEAARERGRKLIGLLSLLN